jgi:hypothetical protein
MYSSRETRLDEGPPAPDVQAKATLKEALTVKSAADYGGSRSIPHEKHSEPGPDRSAASRRLDEYDHRMGRNYLAHSTSDAINAVLPAAGYNFRRLLAGLSISLLRILIALSAAAPAQTA